MRSHRHLAEGGPVLRLKWQRRRTPLSERVVASPVCNSMISFTLLNYVRELKQVVNESQEQYKSMVKDGLNSGTVSSAVNVFQDDLSDADDNAISTVEQSQSSVRGIFEAETGAEESRSQVANIKMLEPKANTAKVHDDGAVASSSPVSDHGSSRSPAGEVAPAGKGRGQFFGD